MRNINKIKIVLFSCLILHFGAFCQIFGEELRYAPIAEAIPLAEDAVVIASPEYDPVSSFADTKAVLTVYSAAMEKFSKGEATGLKLITALGRNSEAGRYIGLSKAEQKQFTENLETELESIEEKYHLSNGFDKLVSDLPKEREEAERNLNEAIQVMLDTADEFAVEILDDPERMRKFNEFFLFNPLDEISSDFIDFNALGAVLEPSETQEELLAEMKKQYFSEIDQEIERLANLASEVEKELLKGKGNFDESEIKEQINEIDNGMFSDEFFENLAEKYTIRIQSIMTKEQKEMLKKIRDTVSDSAESDSETEEKKDDSWKESWQPGDPLPENQKQEREPGTFPVL